MLHSLQVPHLNTESMTITYNGIAKLDNRRGKMREKAWGEVEKEMGKNVKRGYRKHLPLYLSMFWKGEGEDGWQAEWKAKIQKGTEKSSALVGKGWCSEAQMRDVDREDEE